MSALVLIAALAVGEPVRDPFWPVGFDGVRRVISAEPRFPPQAAASTNAAAGAEGAAAASAGGVDAAAGLGSGADMAERAELARRKLDLDRRWSEAAGRLRFGGMLRMQDGRSAVLVNGVSRTEGDLVRFDADGYRFVWRVVASDAERKLRLERVKAVSLNESNTKGKK